MCPDTEQDPLAPTPEDQKVAIEWLGDNRMDIGCGPNPLPGTGILYDWQTWGNDNIRYVDFYNDATRYIPPRNVYCRHVIEDLRYPEHLFELFGKCERGWIETPHPTVELFRGADRQLPYRGFFHHNWFIWVESGTLILCPKYSIIEYWGDTVPIRQFNTYYKWENYGFKYHILKDGVDFEARDKSYIELLKRGIHA